MISIEGVAVWFIPDNGEVEMSFHSYLSDGKIQNAAVALHHMEKMVEFLLRHGLLKKGGRILEQTDGAGSQYKCASALYFMSVISSRFGITYDRAISGPGHGKNLVDGMGAVDKHTLYRAAKKTFKQADVEDPDSKLIAAEIIKNGEVTSIAAKCCHILMLERDMCLFNLIKNR